MNIPFLKEDIKLANMPLKRYLQQWCKYFQMFCVSYCFDILKSFGDWGETAPPGAGQFLEIARAQPGACI